MDAKPKKPPTRSGFCNPSWPLDTAAGRASHGRCRKADCPCDCHRPEVDETPEPDVAVPYKIVAQTRLCGRDYVWVKPVGGNLILMPLPPLPPSAEFSVGPFSIPGKQASR